MAQLSPDQRLPTQRLHARDHVRQGIEHAELIAHAVDVRVPVRVNIDTEALENDDLLEVDAIEDVGEAAGRIKRVAFTAEIDVADEERAWELLCRACKTREEVKDAMVERVGRTPVEPLQICSCSVHGQEVQMGQRTT
jgi:hypothetical protein